MIKCILLCCTPDAITTLCDFISEIHFLQLVQTFENPDEAASALAKGDIELLLTDEYIRPEKIKSLQKILAEKEIFSLCVKRDIDGMLYLDYLHLSDEMKQKAGFNKFMQSINIAYKKLLVRDGAHPVSSFISQKYIFIRTNHKLVKLNLDDIYYFEGLKDYTKIYLRDDKFLLTLRSLKSFEMILPASFIRVHRSYIVSFDKIESVIRNRILVGKHSIPISDSLKNQFFEMLQLYL